MPAEEISISGYARVRRRRARRSSASTRAAVVGNSMGGFIGAELAIEFPERVERLVLVSAAGLTTENCVHKSIIGALEKLDSVAQA